MNFNYQKELVQIWEKAVKLYQKGNTEAENFPISDDLPFLNNIGLNKMDIFDYVEDWICEGTPDLATFLLIHDIRRDFFIEEQKGIHSKKKLRSKDLPGKHEEIEGIVWLPRIIPKARAKLRGELPTETMFCCGGDRAFLQKNDIHPVEFLRITQKAGDQDEIIVQWVVQRIKSNQLQNSTIKNEI
jgi:hypothetical protein